MQFEVNVESEIVSSDMLKTKTDGVGAITYIFGNCLEQLRVIRHKRLKRCQQIEVN